MIDKWVCLTNFDHLQLWNLLRCCFSSEHCETSCCIKCTKEKDKNLLVTLHIGHDRFWKHCIDKISKYTFFLIHYDFSIFKTHFYNVKYRLLTFTILQITPNCKSYTLYKMQPNHLISRYGKYTWDRGALNSPLCIIHLISLLFPWWSIQKKWFVQKYFFAC